MKRTASLFLVFCFLCGIIPTGIAESLEERISSLEKRVQMLESLFNNEETNPIEGELILHKNGDEDKERNHDNTQRFTADVFVYFDSMELFNSLLLLNFTIVNNTDKKMGFIRPYVWINDGEEIQLGALDDHWA